MKFSLLSDENTLSLVDKVFSQSYFVISPMIHSYKLVISMIFTPDY